MPKVSLFNMKGETVGELELNQEVFDVQYKPAVLHQVMVSLLANAHRGTHKAKTRGEVSGGGRKPFRQKGTGQARQGSKRSPLFRGGGTTFGPQPRSYGQKIPTKMRRLAMRSALSMRVREGNISALNELHFDEFSTRSFVNMLSALKADSGRVLVIVNNPDEKVVKSAANVRDLRMVEARNLNLLDIIRFPRVVATQDALLSIEEVLK